MLGGNAADELFDGFCKFGGAPIIEASIEIGGRAGVVQQVGVGLFGFGMLGFISDLNAGSGCFSRGTFVPPIV
jgi:hypothetical protein